MILSPPPARKNSVELLEIESETSKKCRKSFNIEVVGKRRGGLISLTGLINAK